MVAPGSVTPQRGQTLHTLNGTPNRPAHEPHSLRDEDIVALQQTLGNAYVQRLLRTVRPTAGGRGPAVRRDLTREPPGREAEPAALTEEQTQAAISYNTGRYSERSMRVIQDLVGASASGTVDEETVHMVVEWQADFRLTPDGKVGPRTLGPIVQELIRLGKRNGAIWLIIDGHNMSTAGLVSISYDAAVDSNAVTGGPIPGDSTVRVGRAGFSQGYAGLVHTIAHELEHVRQRRAGMAVQATREFLGEAIEIMSVGMVREGLGGFMDDAGRALNKWNDMPAAEQTTNWARFQQVRDRVQERFDRASAASQATHQATVDGYNAVAEPPAAGP